jgi:hypothetical protein
LRHAPVVKWKIRDSGAFHAVIVSSKKKGLSKVYGRQRRNWDIQVSARTLGMGCLRKGVPGYHCSEATLSTRLF